MKRNWIVAGTAWAGIVTLAWWQVSERLRPSCLYGAACDDRLIATRDNIILGGLIVPLSLFVLLTIAGRARIGPLGLRWPRRSSTSRELVPLERTKE